VIEPIQTTWHTIRGATYSRVHAFDGLNAPPICQSRGRGAGQAERDHGMRCMRCERIVRCRHAPEIASEIVRRTTMPVDLVAPVLARIRSFDGLADKVEEIAYRHRVTVPQMLGQSRITQYLRARTALIAYLDSNGWCVEAIANLIGRDKSSVNYALDKLAMQQATRAA